MRFKTFSRAGLAILSLFFAMGTVTGATLSYRSNSETLSRLTFCTANVREITVATSGVARFDVQIREVLHGNLVKPASNATLAFHYGRGTPIPQLKIAKGDTILAVLEEVGGIPQGVSGFVEVMPLGSPLYVMSGKENESETVSVLRQVFAILDETDKSKKYIMLVASLSSTEKRLSDYAFQALGELSRDATEAARIEGVLRKIRDDVLKETDSRLMADRVLSEILPIRYFWSEDRKAFLNSLQTRTDIDAITGREISSRLKYAEDLLKAEEEKQRKPGSGK
ncbi:MAG: hypothetical protein WCK17_08930 [Verrucomicrobiota bacterium]|jgi:hypothetical protein